MGPRRILTLVLAVALSACAQTETPSPSPAGTVSATPTPSPYVPELAISLDPATMEARYQEGLPLFEYDPAAPLELQREPIPSPDGILVEDISYASPKGGEVPAYLITPEEPGSHPGLIVMHGSGGDRGDMLQQGEAYAQTGVVVLLISAPPGRSEPPEPFVEFAPSDREEQIQLIVDLRRGVDVLIEVGADPERIGYMGYSYGGAMGSQLAGVEHRIRAYVLDVADGGLVEHFTGADDQNGELSRLAPDQREAWLAAMEPIEPLYFVRHAAPSALFFQSARHDMLVTAEDSERLHQHASEPKEVVWYDSDHFLPPQAWCDQANWLRSHLGFAEGPVFPGCA